MFALSPLGFFLATPLSSTSPRTKLQWHPFTISSSSSLESDNISVIIKREGKWTTKLIDLVASPTPPERLDVSVEGPYGPASTDFLRHDLLVMVSGGSGVTPFISIIRDLIHTAETLKHPTPQILLVADLTMLDLILPVSGAPPHLSNLNLPIEAYVTRQKQPPPQVNDKSPRTVGFNPRQRQQLAVARRRDRLVIHHLPRVNRDLNEIRNMAASEREMESLPHLSLAESINVYYGERPDLKRYLLERKESSVGVLVCGPKKLRRQVAYICSSGLVENLHFESISFSW
ncbi:hypothetical protein SASPL_137277 [Salvia splendens]|uniref:FAD-binding FR-type domain-containing protein n=1 Tax=Salvia splendens TaxID=180675 RepID=A0A8X8WT46_SALSN|nr:hypothetical protein SASPL_137277 [Salvia splendens]